MRKWQCGAFLLLAALVAAPAQAEPQARLDVQRFTLGGGVHSFITVPTGQILPRRKFGFDAAFDLAVHPLQQSDASLQRTTGVIDAIVAIHARGGFAITDWVQVDLQLPLLQFAATGDGIIAAGGKEQVFSLGDLWISGTFAPLREGKHPLGLGLTPFITLPTGNPNLFLTSGLPTFGLRAAVSKHWKRLRLAGSFGYRLKPAYAAVGTNVAADDELLYSFGVGVAVVPDVLLLHAELNGAGIVGPGLSSVGSADTRSSTHSPLELLINARLRVKKGWDVFWGAGPGITAGVGTPAVRVIAGAGWSPSYDQDGDGLADNVDQCPADKEDVDAFQDADGCPDPDNDNDGVLDTADACVLEPEDKDNFEDQDGCVDPDNDADGLLDAQDRCPAQPEDKDAFQDDDGCPERDNDGDGIDDLADSCPNDREDLDGFEDSDGCAEADNDADGIVDAKDLCPLAPEVKNGVKDEDGCPDETLVVVRGDKLVILEKVLFVTAKDTILKRSYALLESVRQTLASNGGILKVRIEGHTDDVGNDAANQKLSEKRASAILRFLVEGGIDPERLVAVGYGESKPLVPNDNEENRERNRRVEFTILEQSGVGPR